MKEEIDEVFAALDRQIAAMQALRFVWTYGDGAIEKERLRAPFFGRDRLPGAVAGPGHLFRSHRQLH